MYLMYYLDDEGKRHYTLKVCALAYSAPDAVWPPLYSCKAPALCQL
jgi:hypothetical protein